MHIYAHAYTQKYITFYLVLSSSFTSTWALITSFFSRDCSLGDRVVRGLCMLGHYFQESNCNSREIFVFNIVS